jgi:hypothetical protein
MDLLFGMIYIGDPGAYENLSMDQGVRILDVNGDAHYIVFSNHYRRVAQGRQQPGEGPCPESRQHGRASRTTSLRRRLGVPGQLVTRPRAQFGNRNTVASKT